MNWLGHGYHVYDYLVHVPLVVFAPETFPAGRQVAELASHVDLYPTLASALELDSLDGQPQHGIDLHASPASRRRDFRTGPVYLEASRGAMLPRPEQWLTAIRTERYKYVRGLVNDALPEELYDLEADPGERENILAARPRGCRRVAGPARRPHRQRGARGPYGRRGLFGRGARGSSGPPSGPRVPGVARLPARALVLGLDCAAPAARLRPLARRAARRSARSPNAAPRASCAAATRRSPSPPGRA